MFLEMYWLLDIQRVPHVSRSVLAADVQRIPHVSRNVLAADVQRVPHVSRNVLAAGCTESSTCFLKCTGCWMYREFLMFMDVYFLLDVLKLCEFHMFIDVSWLLDV